MILQRLREQTQKNHERVEECFNLDMRLADVARYRDLLERLLGIYAPLEAALASFDWSAVGINFAARRKAGLLEVDLMALGVGQTRLQEIRRSAPVVVIKEMAEALGCMYVLEGATLGGQVICPMVHKRLGLRADTGASFFTSYGDKVGSMWKAFCQAISAACVSEKSMDQAVATAVRTFLYFEAALGGPSARRLPNPSPMRK
jgi:heme oxygenase